MVRQIPPRKRITVKELIELLKKEDPDRVVIMSIDPEGNGFGYLHELATCAWDPENREVGLEELTPELKKAGYSEEDVFEGGQKALCLWPS